ncbi:signal-induced proliferation-associated 1-like protein 2 isoform X5 [Rhineura floridana]|uniref:signal-induced proliferation-associated 1-like protein 2 isoform X5 n=1 Tax=Rhineura floridana TaxID=261503 RepID=UPI002AC849DA|nr:signal-induced proliferation-associated 1-like protein 2 isoform X5 [Rhineura floridana]
MSDQISQEEKRKTSRTSLKLKESARIMQSDDYFARKFKALNGNMGPPASLSATNKGESSNPANGTPAMPKMGVRARVSEWPPKKDCAKELSKATWESRPQTSYESVGSVNGDQNDGQQKEHIDLEFAEAKYALGDIFIHSPHRGLHPIRQRSNSDVTISDIDTEDVLDQNAVNPNTGASLHREYGSTSSIDRQGLSGENFFAMLRGYRVENFEHKTHAPFGFSEFFHCDTTISPSLHAATQISRGEFVRISGIDYMDSALLIGRDRDRSFKWRLKSESVETSLFRKLRTAKSEHETLKFSSELEDSRLEKNFHPWNCQKCFAHYDVQSILFNINEAMATRINVGKRKNITTGASAASQTPTVAGQTGNCESPLGSKEDLNSKENLDADEGDGKSNDLVLNCPYFRNETGGEGDRRIALSRANSASFCSGDSCSFESSLSSHCTNAGVSVLEVPRENQPIHREKVKRYIIEHIDLGAYYYRKFFYGKEHQNYFGVDENLGPVAVSIRREKFEDAKEKEGSQFNYRVVFRTSELTTLRGAILEDAIPSTARHGTARGLPLKEVLEYVIPELSIQCLRQASNSPKVSEQLLKLDEQGLSFQHKIGILYCKADQSTEEEMYNNEMAGPAFEEFLDLLGQRVRLKGFSKYRAQLDNKTDSTGTHSLYTTYKDYEIMFHVSTMLPYMPSNRQQLLRKRHIGNDIVTIVFQEPGALPFTPKNIRSHFQHVFVIVKVHNPCTENVCYSVGVSRSKDVPPFGPPIPKGVTFPKSAVFRDFLLAKVINAENAAHKSEKFRAMATRTRQEYLKDLAENFVTTTTVDTSVKFSFITLGAKKKERVKPRKDAHLFSVGAVIWNVIARDFGQSLDIECLLGISNEFIVLIEKESKNVVFNCSCRDVIGWTSGLMSVKVFYERGECVLLSALDNCADDIREMVQRLEIVTRGCETTEMTLRRNGLGQLGFHVNFEGIVADVEPFGFAWKAGLRQGSRLVEICKVAVATLTHEQMIDLLRTSVTVKVVIIQPHDDGSPRRGCSELCRIPMVEYKLDSEGTPCEYKTPFRRNTTWHRVPAPAGQPLSRASPILGTSDRLQCQQLLQQAQTAIPRSTSFDRKLPDGASHYFRSSPSNQSSSSDPGPSGSSQWRHQVGYDGCQSPLLHDHQGSGPMESEGGRDHEESLEGARHTNETKWHAPSTKVLSSYKDRALQKENSGKDSPNKFSHIGDKNCSSHSSSNTLSSNTSSNSDDKHFGSEDLMDTDLLGLTYIKGASTDSGIDTAPCMPAPILAPLHLAGTRSGMHSRTDQWAESSETAGPDDEIKMYAVHSYASAISSSHTGDGSMGDLSEISSHSRMYNAVDGLSSSRLQGSVTATVSESQRVLSKEAFLKLMIPDNISVEEGRRKFSFYGNLSPRRTLYRTLSDESICSIRRGSSYASSRSSMLDQALPNDILFSTTPPYHSTLPPRTSLTTGTGHLRHEFWFSDGSLSDKSRFNDPGLMPLPDTATGLDWSNLVDAAQAFEDFDSDEELGPVCHHTPFLDQRVASFCTLNDMQHVQSLESNQALGASPTNEKDFIDTTGEDSPTTLTGKVNQLEVILRHLQTDLRKEKQDKAVLQAEVQHLRQDNMRLQEESQTAAAQLRKFTEWFFNTIDKKS